MILQCLTSISINTITIPVSLVDFLFFFHHNLPFLSFSAGKELCPTLQQLFSRSCAKFQRQFGGRPPAPGDGRKFVCMDKRFNIKPGNCTIFSFGVNNEWSFEDEMEKFGCKVG